MNIRSDSNSPKVLASDLDGTFIPLPEEKQNTTDLEILQQQIHEHEVVLCYVTGRHFDLAYEAIKQHHLPTPNWVICNVGTAIYRNNGGTFAEVTDYSDHLDFIVSKWPVDKLRQSHSDLTDLRIQEEEKQSDYKLSYYVHRHKLDETVSQIKSLLDDSNAPWSTISTVDPFTNDGLIDLLPQDVSKAYALDWWSQFLDMQHESIVFAGDSGNDLAVFNAGYRTIMVNNTPNEIVEQVQKVHQKEGWLDRAYYASQKATSGVLEGCHHYKMFQELS